MRVNSCDIIMLLFKGLFANMQGGESKPYSF